MAFSLQIQALVDKLLDLLNQWRHSQYFNQTRSDYLTGRVRIIAWLLVILQPSWLIVDYFLLSPEVLLEIAIARVACAVACFALAMYARGYKLQRAYTCLFLLVTTLSGFHFATTEILVFYGFDSSVAGYQFFPFMVIAMMAVFPLSIIELLVYAFFVLLFEVVGQLLRNNLGTLEGINNLWLLSVLGLIAGWSSVNQLSMLLTLYRQATRDPLTGLSNRRQAIDQMESDIKQAQENAQPLCALLFDLDKFKNFNDTYGHAAGDMVLKRFASILREHTDRKHQLACRYGGEEFLVVLPNTELQAAYDVAETIRQACHKSKVRLPNDKKIGFSTSVGVACLKESEDSQKLLQRADDALYAAKDQGRDQVNKAE